MSLKKIILIIFINVILISVLLACLDYKELLYFRNFANSNFESQQRLGNSVIDKNSREFQVEYGKVKHYLYEDVVRKTRGKIYRGNSDKRPILTIGCSFTEGSFLQGKQTFAYKLNKLTDRTTYNRGIGSTGPQWVYRQLSDKKFKRDVPDAEYVFYTFINDQIRRMFITSIAPWQNYVDLNYRLKDGKLVERKDFLQSFYFSFWVKKYLAGKEQKEIEQEYRNGMPLFIATMQESVNTMHKLYPDSKFVLLDAPEAYEFESCYENNKLPKTVVEKLEKMGIIYIDAEDLVGHQLRDIDKYRVSDRKHPNEAFWDEIAPALVKRLNL